jgi:hypothetical protein
VTGTYQGNERVDHTFETLVQAAGPLEVLVEVRPAVEHSLEGIVIRKLQQGTVKHTAGKFRNLILTQRSPRATFR